MRISVLLAPPSPCPARCRCHSLVSHSLDGFGCALIVVFLHVPVHGAQLHLPSEVDVHRALLHRGVNELIGGVAQLKGNGRAPISSVLHQPNWHTPKLCFLISHPIQQSVSQGRSRSPQWSCRCHRGVDAAVLRMGQGMLWGHSGGQWMLCDRDSTALRMQEPPQ